MNFYRQREFGIFFQTYAVCSFLKRRVLLIAFIGFMKKSGE